MLTEFTTIKASPSGAGGWKRQVARYFVIGQRQSMNF
jgi:hypothetical protein